jgi:predicted AlkP superfamily phosphohydrolase/phosphomutase
VAYQGIRFAKARSFDNFTDEIFDTILQDITKDDDWKDEQYLLVLDDLSTVFERPTKQMLKNFLKHRHYNLSIIIVSQAIRLMNPKLRQNATHLISFYTSNQREREALNELTNLSQSKFDELLEYCTDENYCFMFIDLLQPRKPKIYKNFNSEIVY